MCHSRNELPVHLQSALKRHLINLEQCWYYNKSDLSSTVSSVKLSSYLMSFFRRLLMKSLAWSEISSNASSSKSQVAEVTLARVSLSLSPMNGERPLTLRVNKRKGISGNNL